VFRLLLLALFVTLLAGCGGYAERKKEMVLESTLSQYRTAMRWGHWESLLGMRASKAPALPEFDRDNVRVTGYEILRPPLPVDEGKVLQEVEIQYVLQDSQRVRRLREKQEWRHDEESKEWRIYSPFPNFR